MERAILAVRHRAVVVEPNVVLHPPLSGTTWLNMANYGYIEGES